MTGSEKRPHSHGDALVSASRVGNEGGAVILPKFYLWNFKFTGKKKKEHKSREWRWEEREGERAHKGTKKTTDFHQDRLSNQMGTIQEVGQREWGGTLIGQISAQTRHYRQEKLGFLSAPRPPCHSKHLWLIRNSIFFCWMLEYFKWWDLPLCCLCFRELRRGQVRGGGRGFGGGWRRWPRLIF